MTLHKVFNIIMKRLEEIFYRLEKAIESPVFINDIKQSRFRYKSTGVEPAIILRAARIISGLNSMLCLHKGGFVQEMGVITRTIDEFSDDIIFLLEGYPDAPLTKSQEQWLSNFFQEEFDQPHRPLDSTQKRKTVKRRKVHASVARQMSEIMEQERTQQLHRTLHQVFSGYVHGAASNILEMYGGKPPKYHLNGLRETPRITEWEKHTVHYVYRGIISLMLISIALQRNQEFQELYELRTFFEKQTNYDLS